MNKLEIPCSYQGGKQRLAKQIVDIFYEENNIDDDTSIDRLNKLITPFILRRKKKDVLKDLPDKIENNIIVELNDEQKKLYLMQLEKTKMEMLINLVF